jgi:hypothetical protein
VISPKPTFFDIPLEHVAIEDRPVITKVARAILISQAVPCQTWSVDVLPKRSYNNIVISYSPDTVFLLKEHLIPILKQDPGLSESPKVEYIIDMWTEMKNNCNNLVCRVKKHGELQLLANDVPSNRFDDDGVDVFDEKNNYVYLKSKKRKL